MKHKSEKSEWKHKLKILHIEAITIEQNEYIYFFQIYIFCEFYKFWQVRISQIYC